MTRKSTVALVLLVSFVALGSRAGIAEEAPPAGLPAGDPEGAAVPPGPVIPSQPEIIPPAPGTVPAPAEAPAPPVAGEKPVRAPRCGEECQRLLHPSEATHAQEAASPSPPPAPPQKAAPPWQSDSFQMRASLGMNQAGTASSHNSASFGIELDWQSQYVALAVGIDVDWLKGSSLGVESFPATFLLRCLSGDDELYLGPRAAFVTASDGSGTSENGWSYGAVLGWQQGSGSLAYGLALGLNEVYFTHECVLGQCADGQSKGMFLGTVRFTLSL
jgi:hypothetical protein